LNKDISLAGWDISAKIEIDEIKAYTDEFGKEREIHVLF